MDDTEKLKAIEAKLRESGFENVEGLLEDRTKTKGELDSVKSQMSNAQETIQRQGNELGELRKSVKELEAEKAARDATGSNENEGGNNNTDGKSGEGADDSPQEETLEQIEKSLTDEQWEVVDKIYNDLPEDTPEQRDEKLSYARKGDARKKFLTIAREEVVVIPKSLKPSQQTPGKGDSSGDEDRIKKLFEKAKAGSNFVPPGPRGRKANQTGVDRKEKKPTSAVRGGVLAAARERREE